MASIDSLSSQATRFIAAQCLRDDKLSSELLDEHQLACYDLALIRAEKAALDMMQSYSAREKGPMAHLLTRTLAAHLHNSIWHRFIARAQEFGLDLESVNAVFSALLSDAPVAADIDDLASQILRENTRYLPSLLDQDKQMMRDSFARFATAEVMPQAESIHRQDSDIPESLIQSAAALGCFGTCIPERFGGLQPDAEPDSLAMIVVTEELSRGSLGAAGSLITRPEIAARALLAGGTTAQQEYWLPRLSSGATLCAISITEPDTGSDVAAVTLKATQCDDGWTLSGTKTWCTFAGRSELLVVLARTGEQKGHRGLSLFLIEKPAFSGHEFEFVQPNGGKLSGRAIATLGYRGMHSFELFFDNFHVPADKLIGGKAGEGQGFYYTMAGFAGGRIQTAARATGVMQAAYESALQYAQQRRVFNKSLGEFQLTRNKLVLMLGMITASRQFSYHVAKELDSGAGQMEASLVKLFSCRAAEWVTREAMQLHGGMGYAEETSVSRYWVDARVLSIFEGAEEVLALKVIARDLLANAVN